MSALTPRPPSPLHQLLRRVPVARVLRLVDRWMPLFMIGRSNAMQCVGFFAGLALRHLARRLDGIKSDQDT